VDQAEALAQVFQYYEARQEESLQKSGQSHNQDAAASLSSDSQSSEDQKPLLELPCSTDGGSTAKTEALSKIHSLLSEVPDQQGCDDEKRTLAAVADSWGSATDSASMVDALHRLHVALCISRDTKGEASKKLFTPYVRDIRSILDSVTGLPTADPQAAFDSDDSSAKGKGKVYFRSHL
jgi:hypothetical protein